MPLPKNVIKNVDWLVSDPPVGGELTNHQSRYAGEEVSLSQAWIMILSERVLSKIEGVEGWRDSGAILARFVI